MTELSKRTAPPRLEATVQFAGHVEGHARAETVYRLYRRGHLHGVSVGFLVRSSYKPSEKEREARGLGPYGVVIDKAELMELSAVAVPSDSNALLAGA